MSNDKTSGMSRLAAFIAAQNAQPVPESALHASRLCLLDTIGVGLYGSTQPEADMLIKGVAGLGSGIVNIWGRSETLDAGSAALIGGSLCHLRELDDVHYAILHTGCVCVPAAMAAAQLEGSTFGELLRALINGVEVTARISFGMDYMEHREIGWHGTATCGAFGSAASTGYLIGLNEHQLADAMGLAGSRTGGTWAFSADGAMSKRLHPGLASRDGLVSAYLAKAGVSGPHYVLEAEDGGFYRLFSPEWDMERIFEPKDKLEIENVEYKYFASCKSVHSPITAALHIHDTNPERTPEEIAKVTVEVNRSALSMAGRSYESDSVVSAQISIPYGIGLGLLGRKGQAEDYELSRLADTSVRRIADLTEVVESEEFNELRATRHLSGCRVTVLWTDGTSSAFKVTEPKGCMANPLTEEDILEKFISLASCTLGRERAIQILEFIMHADESSAAAKLIELITP